jgi:hypothetical protein
MISGTSFYLVEDTEFIEFKHQWVFIQETNSSTLTNLQKHGAGWGGFGLNG